MLGHQTDAMDSYYTHYQRADLEAAVSANYLSSDQNKKND